MLHYLTLGHLDKELIQNEGTIAVLRPLDPTIVERLLAEHGGKDAAGHPMLGRHRVQWNNGFVQCAWKMPLRVQATDAFARRLNEETGCVMADVDSRRLVSRDELL